MGYAIRSDDSDEESTSILDDSSREELIALLRGYLDSTGVEYRIWRDLGEEYKNPESFGIWVLLHWDSTTSPFPLQSHDPWELVEFDYYQNIFQKEEPDEDEGE